MSQYRVGCAGWHYQDWVGPVYPPRLPTSRWLERYATLFPVVEIDSTFYEIPSEATVEGWLQRVRASPGFSFCAKVPQKATHESLPRGDTRSLDDVIGRFLERVVDPLEHAGRMETILVQLPPTFAMVGIAEDGEPLDQLAALLDLLGPKKRRVAVEFRHASWYEHLGERLHPEVVDALSGRGAACVRVDGLGSQFTKSRTTRWSYFRLHGRRGNIPPGERSLRHAKYNYLYAPQEISELAQAVRQAAAEDERTIVIFNNHYRGQAARNGLDLLAALGLARPSEAVMVARETRLDDFDG